MPAGSNGYAAMGYARPNNQVSDQEYGIGGQVSGRIGVRTGTSSRVAGMLLLAGATLAAMKLAGFRFNVGVTN